MKNLSHLVYSNITNGFIFLLRQTRADNANSVVQTQDNFKVTTICYSWKQNGSSRGRGGGGVLKGRLVYERTAAVDNSTWEKYASPDSTSFPETESPVSPGKANSKSTSDGFWGEGSNATSKF